VCVCQRARACLPACAWVPGCVTVCMRERAYSLAYPACIAVRHIVTSFVVPLSLPYFSTMSRKQNDFRKKVTEYQIYVLIFSKEFVWNISRLRINQRDIVINVETSSHKVPVIFVRFYWNLNFLDRVSKKSQISNFINIRLIGVEPFHADRRAEGQTDGRMDMVKLIVAFRNFACAPRNLHRVNGGSRFLRLDQSARYHNTDDAATNQNWCSF
jgi:hypothetical protein